MHDENLLFRAVAFTAGVDVSGCVEASLQPTRQPTYLVQSTRAWRSSPPRRCPLEPPAMIGVTGAGNRGVSGIFAIFATHS